MGNKDIVSHMQRAILRFENGEIDVDHLFTTLESHANALEALTSDHVRIIRDIFQSLGDLDGKFSGAELRSAIVNELNALEPVLQDLLLGS